MHYRISQISLFTRSQIPHSFRNMSNFPIHGIKKSDMHTESQISLFIVSQIPHSFRICQISLFMVSQIPTSIQNILNFPIHGIKFLNALQSISNFPAFVTPFVEHWLEREIAQWVHPMNDRSDDPSHHERTLLPRSYISLPHPYPRCY